MSDTRRWNEIARERTNLVETPSPYPSFKFIEMKGEKRQKKTCQNVPKNSYMQASQTESEDSTVEIAQH